MNWITGNEEGEEPDKDKDRDLGEKGGKEMVGVSYAKITESKKKKKQENKGKENQEGNGENKEEREKGSAEKEREKDRDRIVNTARKKTPTNEAVIIKTKEGTTYADTIKKLRKDMPEYLLEVKNVRKTRGGDVILEMDRNGNTSNVEDKVKKTLGEERSKDVKKLIPKVLYTK